MRYGRYAGGFVYLAALFAIAALGAILVATAQIWSHAAQREKETELRWIGEQYRQAIGLYYQRSPGTLKRYPKKLEDLIEDRRHLTVQRYVRKIYSDPMTGKADWAVILAPDGGVMGVRSVAEQSPIHQVASATHYGDWSFVYEPPAPLAASR